MKDIKERWKQESSQMVPKDPSKDTKKSFEIFKTDEDQRLVFGWASVAINVAGETLEDRQHDMIDPEDLEEAAYEYVLNFRDTGEEHLPGYRKKGRLVESCVFTPEKQAAIGIPPGTVPVAWWIGFKIEDEDTWQRVKNGTYRMFSIEGKAEREEVRKADSTAQTFDDVLKFNPYHGWHGYFASANSAGAFAPIKGKTENGQRLLDQYKEKHGGKAGGGSGGTSAGSTKPDNKQSTLEESVKDVKLTSKMKDALQPRNYDGDPIETTKVAEDHYQPLVVGKDISKSFDYEDVVFDSHKDPIDAIAEAQGWNKGATVTNDRELFDKACVQSGVVLCRTVHSDGNKDANQVCHDTMVDGDMPLGGTGGKALGTGMYMTNTKLGAVYPNDPSEEVKWGQGDSWPYGDTQMMATLHPKAKIATPAQANTLADQWYNMSTKEQERFGFDRNAFIASKGYDGVKWHSDSDPGAYCTIFNKSALIFYGGVGADN